MNTVLLTNFVILLALFLALWLLSLRLKNASIVDIFWGPACALPAVLTWFQTGSHEPRATLITVLVAIWGIRLGSHLALRNIGHGEDFRYKRMREKSGGDAKFALKSLSSVFIMQCCLAFFISLPTQVGQFGSLSMLNLDPGALGVLSCLGVLVFLIGLAFESVGDYQLKQFKTDPANKGKLIETGLWAWTRHPNYFGDFAVWVGLTIIALESSYGFATVLSPAMMFYFLYVFSGKELLERMMARRYPEFDAYKQRVSGFFPWPPGKR